MTFEQVFWTAFWPTAIALAIYIGTYFPATPKVYRERRCKGRDWYRCFPNAQKEDMRTFLELFAVDALGFDKKDLTKFSPSDRIMDVYQAIYPKPSLADGLELETFFCEFEKRHGIDLEEVWVDGMTLGDVFAVTQARA